MTCVCAGSVLLSCVPFFATPWTVVCQAPLSMGFPGPEYWSGLPFPSPGDLPNPGIKPRSPALQVYTLTSEPPGKLFKHVQFSSVQSLSHVWLFVTPWITAHQASLSITNSQSLLKLTSIESVSHPAISSSVVPFSSCPKSFPASGSFPMSQLFAWGGHVSCV